MTYAHITTHLKRAAKTNFVNATQFFKTGDDSYSKGDVFIGVRKGDQRIIAKRYFETITQADVVKLLQNSIHEYRSIALLLLEFQYALAAKKHNVALCEKIYAFTLSHIGSINNWDLVDQIAPNVIGRHLFTKADGVSQLRKWCADPNIWVRRIGIVSTWYYNRQGSLDATYELAPLLFADSHDLIHKATGWMLREAGRRDMARLEKFIRAHYSLMSRTCLRYAIEKFDDPLYDELLSLGK